MRTPAARTRAPKGVTPITIERRYLTSEVEVRSAPAGHTIITGYAALFGRRSQDLGGFVEQVAPGTFGDSIRSDDVRALFNHNADMVLGRTRSGTLRLSEDSAGLHYEVDSPDTSYARDLAVSMERGDITQSSFAFRTRADDWGFTEQDVPLRTLRDVMLLDVSPVAYPAYLDATSGLGHRALERLAEARGLALADVRADVSAALRTVSPPARPDTIPHRDDDTDLIRLSALARLL